jgi:hypothetical protein
MFARTYVWVLARLGTYVRDGTYERRTYVLGGLEHLYDELVSDEHMSYEHVSEKIIRVI